jgi:hypothetical protein
MGKMRVRSSIVGAVLGLVLAGGFLAGRAWAEGIPATGALTYTGTLEDVNGVALTGAKSIEVRLWDAQTAGTQQCSAGPTSLNLVGGRFQLSLPDACTASAKAGPDRWVEVLVDAGSLGRTKLGAVPYAVEASHAATATSATNSTNAASATNAGHAASADTSTNATNSTNASNATGALATQMAALTQRLTTLEAKPAPLTRVDFLTATTGDPFFTECLNQTGTFVAGACERMAYHACVAKGFTGGWFEGDLFSGGGPIGIQCIK